jgi:plastocyanin domain-containing protein
MHIISFKALSPTIFTRVFQVMLLLVSVASTPVLAEDKTQIQTQTVNNNADDIVIRIKDHQFIPAQSKVPTGKRIKLTIKNEDTTPEEFESHSLNREKLIPANSQINVYVGPLKAGSYAFVGEFHEKTAKGTLIAE